MILFYFESQTLRLPRYRWLLKNAAMRALFRVDRVGYSAIMIWKNFKSQIEMGRLMRQETPGPVDRTHLGRTGMNGKKIRHYFWFQTFFCALITMALLCIVRIGEAQERHPLQSKKDFGASTKTSPDQKGEKETDMADKGKLTEEQGQYLVGVARRTIERELQGIQTSEKPDADLPSVFHEERGTFVTLTIGGNLRGCIGHITPQESLIEGIRINAINAAFRDPRFRPLSEGELEKTHVEISILTEPKPLAYSDGDDLLRKLRRDIDGVIIKQGYRQATFLPQVWEQLPRKEDFLTHLCLKAGLAGDAWKKGELKVSVYQVQAFEEK
jgi:AmmeMemoRadiSam system protein A